MKFTTTTFLLLSLFHLASGSNTRGVKKDSTKRSLSANDTETAQAMCSMFQDYDNMVRFNRVGTMPFQWTEYCDEFDHLDYLLCPDQDTVNMICAYRNPHRNPAVNASQCQPMVEALPEGEEKHTCLLNCVNFISKTKGDCCKFACPPTPPPSPGKGTSFTRPPSSPPTMAPGKGATPQPTLAPGKGKGTGTPTPGKGKGTMSMGRSSQSKGKGSKFGKGTMSNGKGKGSKPNGKGSESEGMGKGSSSKDSQQPMNELEKAQAICNMWQVYDNMVRFNRVGTMPFQWTEYCEEFEPMDYLLCPDQDTVDAICDYRFPYRNPAVNATQCQPMVAALPEGEEKHTCLLNCVNYISKTKGDCCEFACPSPPPTPGK